MDNLNEILEELENLLSIFGYDYKKDEDKDYIIITIYGDVDENHRHINCILSLCGGYISEIDLSNLDMDGHRENTIIYIQRMNDGLDPDSSRYTQLLKVMNRVSDSNTNELFLHLHDRYDFKRVVDENNLLAKYYSPFF